MNQLPINSETDIIKSILAETAAYNELNNRDLNEDTGGAIMRILGKVGGKLARTPKALPPGAGTDLARITGGAITTPGKVEWEPIPQLATIQNTFSGLQDTAKNIPWGGLAAAAGLGGLAYLGSQASKDKKQERSMLPVSPAKEIGGVKISPTSPTGVTDPNKAWVPQTPAAPKPLTPEPSTITKPALSDYKMAPKNIPPVEMPSASYNPFHTAPAAKKQPTAVSPVSTPRSTGTVAPGQMFPTRADEPNIPAPGVEPAVKKPESKLPEQPMDVAAMAAQMRTDRFAAERDKATPEQRAAVEANAKRLGVTPWTQEHYDAVSKDIDAVRKDMAGQKTQSTPQTSSTETPTRDTSKIVPGSQMWSELSAEERKSVRDRYAKGEGPSISIRYNKETGKFDEPGYGEQGQYGDIVKALNLVNEQTNVERYCKFISENLGVNLRGYQASKKAQRKGRLYQKQLETRPEMSWSGDTATVPDLPAINKPSNGVNPETFVKQHVIKLMTQAQEKGVKMTHGQAHRAALDLLKKHMGHD